VRFAPFPTPLVIDFGKFNTSIFNMIASAKGKRQASAPESGNTNQRMDSPLNVLIVATTKGRYAVVPWGYGSFGGRGIPT